MGEIKDLVARIKGKYDPVKYKLKFVVTPYNEPSILNGEVSWLVNDMIGSNYLNDIFDDKVMNDLPTDYGVYSAELCVKSYRSNAPQDPEEWDMNMWLENIKIEMKL